MKSYFCTSPKLEHPDENGQTPLIWAALKNAIRQVALLIKHKANLEAKDKQGYTALLWAAYNGHTEIVNLLIEAKANPHVVGNQGETAMFWAAYHGHTELMHLLIREKVNIDNAKRNPLIAATIQHQFAAVELLIKAGANLEIMHNFDTALTLAVQHKGKAIAFILLDAMSAEQITFACKAHPSIYSTVAKFNKSLKSNQISHCGDCALLSIQNSGYLPLKTNQEQESSTMYVIQKNKTGLEKETKKLSFK